ncbi:MAG: cytochrome ubiquinol oxidase subunit I [bacterium]|nr:cytochrome ubiquinol oxidase subunit I [bacterium]
MDAILLARIQFAFAAGFHFLFPPTTLGLSFVIVIVESLNYKTGKEIYKKLSTFLVKILGLVFVVGAATGITLEFAFGTNWSEYSRMVGDIFGAPLAAEGLFAFFLESIFLGILLFGREKVSAKMYLLSAFLVFFGSHMSGFWIIIANSFMQTPAGFKVVDGRAILTDFYAAAFNPSTMIRFIHTLIGGWITGSLFTAAIGSWYLIKKKHTEIAKKLVTISLILFVFASILQLGSGHSHSVQVTKNQPAKMAAFEGLWETRTHAPLLLFGIPDEKNEKTHFQIGIPSLLSYMVYFDTEAEIKGLKEFPKDERPPVLLSFASYHIMIALGTAFLLLAIIATYLMLRKKLWDYPLFLKILLYAVPLPYIANEFGWMAAEVGRQPWVVYNVFKTADAVSIVVPAWQILVTLIMFICVYTLIFIVFMKLLLKIIRKGPETPGTTEEPIAAGY